MGEVRGDVEGEEVVGGGGGFGVGFVVVLEGVFVFPFVFGVGGAEIQVADLLPGLIVLPSLPAGEFLRHIVLLPLVRKRPKVPHPSDLFHLLLLHRFLVEFVLLLVCFFPAFLFLFYLLGDALEPGVEDGVGFEGGGELADVGVVVGLEGLGDEGGLEGEVFVVVGGEFGGGDVGVLGGGELEEELLGGVGGGLGHRMGGQLLLLGREGM